MEIGIQGSGQLTDGAPDPGRYRAIAELAEELGYDSIWAGEHLSFHNPILDLGVALAVFAAVTERILLGVGVGGQGAQDFEAAGVPLAERGSRADEGIAALRRLFADRPASFSGCHYRFRNVSIEPAPVQPGGPPILVGGRSEAAQRRAGALGDGWLPYLVSPRTFAAGVETVRAHALAVDRDPTELRHGVVAFARVEDDGVRAREAAREHLSQRYGMRFEPYHVEHLCVAGTPEECSVRVQAYADAGASHLALNPAVDGDGFLSQVERLRTIVAPAREVRT